MTLSENIEERLALLDKVIKKSQQELKDLPLGTLRIKTERGSKRYYCFDSVSKQKTYIKGNDTELLSKLERRNYLEKLVASAQSEKKILCNTLAKLKENLSIERAFFSIPETKRKFVEPINFTSLCLDDKKVESWKHTYFKKKYEDENSFLVTCKGERVRSKSELIIADRLYAAKVPYHYEAELYLADENLGQFFHWNPDFTVLNEKTGKTYYWEHFGLMDNRDYFSDFQFKLFVYARNNIFLGDNLIATMETSSSPLSTEYVERLIEKFLK